MRNLEPVSVFVPVRRAIVVVAAALATGSAACGGGFSSEPRSYIPREVEGRAVTSGDGFGESLRDAFAVNGRVEQSAAGIVGAPDAAEPVPDAVLVAVKGHDLGLESVGAQLRLLFGTGEGEAGSATTAIGGVQVETVDVGGAGGTAGALAFASPADGVGVVVFSLGGGRDTALAAMKAMLDAGS